MHDIAAACAKCGRGGEFTFCSTLAVAPPRPPPPVLQSSVLGRRFGCCMQVDPHALDDCSNCLSYGMSAEQRSSSCHESRSAWDECAAVAHLERSDAWSAGLYCDAPTPMGCNRLRASVVVEASWKYHLNRDVVQLWIDVHTWSPKADMCVVFPQLPPTSAGPPRRPSRPRGASRQASGQRG